MFKLQVQEEKKGDWIDVINSTSDGNTAYERLEYYTNKIKRNNYRIVPVNVSNL
tara:strand:+ start:5636 stop:5797 length:162 start_codon:yes stop_codon:yes gene_type:complete